MFKCAFAITRVNISGKLKVCVATLQTHCAGSIWQPQRFSLLMNSSRNMVTTDVDSITASQQMKPLPDNNGLPLHSVVARIQEQAPLEYAENWDNVGLLIEPSSQLIVKRILLTNDLTQRVMDEAISMDANLIISYHPPLFKPFKSLTQKMWKERIAIQCIEHKIAVFSPHTALDAVLGGVNDWLLSCFACHKVVPLTESCMPPTHYGISEHNISVNGSLTDEVIAQLESLSVNRFQKSDTSYNLACNQTELSRVLLLLTENNVRIEYSNQTSKLPLPYEGMGRLGLLIEKMSIADIVKTVKSHLGLTHLRLALANLHTEKTLIHSIAVCAGSGASVLRNARAEVFITGEMSHHELLDTIHNGSTVILCEHSNTERQYLHLFRQTLLEKLPLDITVSQVDTDPIQIV